MHYFNFHTHRFTNQNSVFELVNQYPLDFDATIPYYSIGIHPWYINENNIYKELQIIESKMDLENCLAIGECGLDKRIDIPMDIQIRVFEQQLLLAEKYKKPVVIHCVAAFQEVIEVKKRLQLTIPMLIHGFSKNEMILKELIKNDFYISFGKYLIRNPDLETVFQSVPNDCFFLETDTIEETIQEVYDLAATYKKCNVEALEKIINSNFETVFNRKINQ